MNIDLPTGYTSITTAELARLQAIEKAAEMMANQMRASKALLARLQRDKAVYTEPSLIHDKDDANALAEYEKAVKK